MKHQSQGQRILAVLEAACDDVLDIPEGFILRKPEGVYVSGRYFKREMWISECNARISELRAKIALDGRAIEVADEKDIFGFSYHRIVEPAARQRH